MGGRRVGVAAGLPRGIMQATRGAACGPRSMMPSEHLVPERKFAVANIKSQIKRNRQNEVRRVKNKAVRSTLKTAVKKVDAAAAEGDSDAAEAVRRDASRALDKAASRGVIHKRTAARRKSRLARRVARSAES